MLTMKCDKDKPAQLRYVWKCSAWGNRSCLSQHYPRHFERSESLYLWTYFICVGNVWIRRVKIGSIHVKHFICYNYNWLKLSYKYMFCWNDPKWLSNNVQVIFHLMLWTLCSFQLFGYVWSRWGDRVSSSSLVAKLALDSWTQWSIFHWV